MLTPDQLLKLYDLLPDRSLMTTSPDSAVAPLRRWMRDHPELVRRTPASYIIRGALWLSEAARVRATESPLAGTYRFVLSVPTGDSVAFFARTGIHPTSELRDFRSRSRTSDSVEPARAPGYYLAAYVAKSVAELPTVAPRSPHYQQGYVAALFDPEVGTADSTVWQGSVDLIEHAARLLPPGDLRSRIEKAHATMWSMLTRDERTLVPGRFVRRAGGSVHYTLDAKRSGVQVVSMRGERIALDPLRER